MLEFQEWGLIPYGEAAERQLLLLDQVGAGFLCDQVVFCSHPPVVTLGRSTRPGDLRDWPGEVFETSRGGRATYHGPEQLVIYPIVDLKKERKNLRSRDVHQFLRLLETTLIASMKELGVEAHHRPEFLRGHEWEEHRTRSEESPRTEGFDESKNLTDDVLYTGVWVGDQKLASIGIGVKKWVSYHGAAVNLWGSELAFQGIAPCGFQQNTMTHLEAKTGKRYLHQDLIRVLKPIFISFWQE